MSTNELTIYLKKAFELKENREYKESIDYFYKALAIDNESVEIMHELAFLYTKICKYDRALSFYDQILLKDSTNNIVKFEYAKLLQKIGENEKAKTIYCNLYDENFEPENVAEELFPILISENEHDKLIEYFNRHKNGIKSSQILYMVALSYIETGNKPLAIEYLKQAYEGDNTNIQAGVHIVKFLIDGKKYDEAEHLIIRMLQYSESEQLYYYLGEIYYLKSDIDNAIKYYSYAIKRNPQKSVYLFKIAILFSLKGYYREAEEAFGRAISLEPDNIDYNYALAYLYYTNNKEELAQNLVDYVLNIQPDNIQALSLKALICTKNAQALEARQLIKQMDKNPNKDDFAYYVIAAYYENLNMWRKAKEYIEKASELNKDSVEYKYLIAKYSYNLNEKNEAIKICEDIIKNNPKYIQAYILLAKTEKESGNFVDAKKYIDCTLNLDKNVAEIYYIQAEIYYAEKNWEKAIENYKISLSINPSVEETYAKTAECYYNIENYAESLIYYKEAADIDLTNPEYRYYVAKCYEKIENYEEAITNYSIMKRLAPQNIEYIKEYANCLYLAGKKKKAKAMLKNLLKDASAEEKKTIKEAISLYK